jgi:hypothetical protein
MGDGVGVAVADQPGCAVEHDATRTNSRDGSSEKGCTSNP